MPYYSQRNQERENFIRFSANYVHKLTSQWEQNMESSQPKKRRLIDQVKTTKNPHQVWWKATVSLKSQKRLKSWNIHSFIHSNITDKKACADCQKKRPLIALYVVVWKEKGVDPARKGPQKGIFGTEAFVFFSFFQNTRISYRDFLWWYDHVQNEA